MRYEEVPRPLVEEHYHIRELIERQEKRSSDRQYHKDKQKEREERDNLIKDSKMSVITDFWCDECKEDFKSVAVRQIETDWSNSEQMIAFYKTKCFKGHWCIRLITDKFNDAYWSKSKKVALDRGKHFADTIQPFETGYNMLYGKK